jgi:radical SAM protein with 4Fe4S-binding SPASM domain
MIKTKRFSRIYIEISNQCNLQCSFCPVVERSKQIMTSHDFETVLAQAAPLSEEVCLHLMGEPLSHPELEKIIEVCTSHGAAINLTTNGTLLSEKTTALLLSPIVRQVNISLQSFINNFPGQSLERYLIKVFDFVKAAIQSRPDLYINLRLWNRSQAATSADELTHDTLTQTIFNAIADQLNVQVGPLNLNLRRKKSILITGRLYLNFDTRFRWPNMADPIRSNFGFCHALSHHIGIHADGTVVPCCLDKEAVLRLGNVFDEPLSQILSGKRAEAMLEGFKRGECVEDLCKKCDFIQRFDRKTFNSARGTRSEKTVARGVSSG